MNHVLFARKVFVIIKIRFSLNTKFIAKVYIKKNGVIKFVLLYKNFANKLKCEKKKT